MIDDTDLLTRGIVKKLEVTCTMTKKNSTTRDSLKLNNTRLSKIEQHETL